MHKFPSINQFRNVIKYARMRAQYVGKDELGNPIYDETITDAPTITYRLTPKLHGTNAGIGFDCYNDKIWYQSRENVLEEGKDNAQFRQTFVEHESALRDAFSTLARQLQLECLDQIVIFGEWCGQGIQKGVAISELPKMLVLFGFRIYRDNGDGYDTGPYYPADVLAGLFTDIPGIRYITEFSMRMIEIDFEKPELVHNEMVELCTQIEDECPVGKAFGVSGVGEGFVAIPAFTAHSNDSNYWFKVKGEKHSVSKVKTLAAVDVEAVNNLREFIANTVTEARLEQGLQNLINEQQKPFDMTSLGDTIRWVVGDIIKEESDTMAASNILPKSIGGPVATAVKKWFIPRLNKLA